jgi:hypothetical protein
MNSAGKGNGSVCSGEKKMRTEVQIAALVFLAIAVSMTDAAAPTLHGEVTLSLKADKVQPDGFPIIVEVTVTNASKENVRWWCGGPARYPGAEHFSVEVRFGWHDGPWAKWHAVGATNGQYIEGSGIGEQLAPRQSIIVPLALPLDSRGPFGPAVGIRVWPRDWHAAAAAEAEVERWRGPEYADQRRVHVITSALADDPFWLHFAEDYPDPVVTDAMLRMVAVDCPPIADAAARVLSAQKTLPETSGVELAAMVRKWLARTSHWGGLQYDIVSAALKTQNEAARQAVLDLLDSSPELSRGMPSGWMFDLLSSSPGDSQWLIRARAVGS